MTLWPAAQILGDLARHLGFPGAETHYRHALAIAEKARVQPWRDAAMRSLGVWYRGISMASGNPRRFRVPRSKTLPSAACGCAMTSICGFAVRPG